MGTSGGGVIPSGLGVEWAAYLRAERGDGGDGGQLAWCWRGRLGGGLELGLGLGFGVGVGVGVGLGLGLGLG